MTDAEQRTIDELMSEITDGAAGDHARRLSGMLLDRPDLQRYYRRSATVMALLQLEFTQSALRPSSVESMGDPLTATSPISLRPQRAARPLTTRCRRGTTGIVAAAIVAGIASLAALQFASEDPSPEQVAIEALASAWSQLEETPRVGRGVAVRDPMSLELVSRVTRQPEVTNLVIPVRHAAKESSTTLCRGSVWIHRDSQQIERGHLLMLPPGCLVKAEIDAEALGMNSLAVVELDSRGAATGETLMFDNSDRKIRNALRQSEPVAGRIGSFAKRNTSGRTEYFLLIGSHALRNAEGNESWYQSDYRIQFDAEGVLVIGWDDSGYAGDERDASEFPPDRDYDDIRVVLRFSFPDAPAYQRSFTPSRHLPSPTLGGGADGELGIGRTLEIPPRCEAVISASTDALQQNSMRIVEVSSKRIIWKHDGYAPDKGQQSGKPNDLGVYLIRNRSDEVIRYEVQGFSRRTTGASHGSRWDASPWRVLFNDGRAQAIGFEDSLNDGDAIDWRDLLVYVRVFSD